PDAVVHERAVHHRPLDQLDVARVEHVLDVLAPAGREIVQDQHLIASRRQRVHEVRSDEAGSSGDEISHRAVPPKWRLPYHSAGGAPSIIVSRRPVRRGDVSPLSLLTDDRPRIGVYSRLMRSRPRKHTTGPVAAAVVLSALL